MSHVICVCCLIGWITDCWKIFIYPMFMVCTSTKPQHIGVRWLVPFSTVYIFAMSIQETLLPIPAGWTGGALSRFERTTFGLESEPSFTVLSRTIVLLFNWIYIVAFFIPGSLVKERRLVDNAQIAGIYKTCKEPIPSIILRHQVSDNSLQVSIATSTNSVSYVWLSQSNYKLVVPKLAKGI